MFVCSDRPEDCWWILQCINPLSFDAVQYSSLSSVRKGLNGLDNNRGGGIEGGHSCKIRSGVGLIRQITPPRRAEISFRADQH